MKNTLFILLICFNISFTAIGQDKISIEQYFEAYKESYGVFDIGLNTPKGQEMNFKVFEKTETYIRFGIDEMNLYIEMALFQGENEWEHFVITHKYFNQDFRTSIHKLKCLSFNQTPLGNPLEELEILPQDEIYAYYYRDVALMQTQTFLNTNDKKDLNYQKVILPKNGGNIITLQFAIPKIQNGAVVEEMSFKNGKALVQIDAKFTTWGTLKFQKKHKRFEFEAQ